MGGIIRGIEGICLEINGVTDQVHILAKLPPKIAISSSLRVAFVIKILTSSGVAFFKSGFIVEKTSGTRPTLRSPSFSC